MSGNDGGTVAAATSGVQQARGTVGGGDVVCKKVTGMGFDREGVGMYCSLLSWCAGGRCVTSGSYDVGDVLYRCTYGNSVGMHRVGVVGESKLKDDMPETSRVCLVDLEDPHASDSFRSHGKRIAVRPEPADGSAASNLQVDIREAATGSVRNMFGNCHAEPPQEGVMSVTTTTSRLHMYHQGAVFRNGRNAVCVYNGMLETDDEDFAACYKVSTICKYHPEMCMRPKGSSAPATAT